EGKQQERKRKAQAITKHGPLRRARLYAARWNRRRRRGERLHDLARELRHRKGARLQEHRIIGAKTDAYRENICRETSSTAGGDALWKQSRCINGPARPIHRCRYQPPVNNTGVTLVADLLLGWKLYCKETSVSKKCQAIKCDLEKQVVNYFGLHRPSHMTIRPPNFSTGSL